MLISTKTAADNWGFSAQLGANHRQLALSFAKLDNPRSMREWYFGCRLLELDAELSQASFAAPPVDSQLQGRGCGLAFSWRYFFPTGYFLGVRNDWWRTFYQLRDQSGLLGKSRIDSLTPALITGWRIGSERVSFDLFISVGHEFNLVIDGDGINSYNIVLGGFVLRF